MLYLYDNVHSSMLEPARPLANTGTECCRALLPREKKKGDLLRNIPPPPTCGKSLRCLMQPTTQVSQRYCFSGETIHEWMVNAFQSTHSDKYHPIHMETAPGSFGKHVRDRITSFPTEDECMPNAEGANATVLLLEESSYRTGSERNSMWNSSLSIMSRGNGSIGM
jgi:hypothetical protein